MMTKLPPLPSVCTIEFLNRIVRGTEDYKSPIDHCVMVQWAALQGRADTVKVLLLNSDDNYHNDAIKGCVYASAYLPRVTKDYTPEVKAVLELAVKTMPELKNIAEERGLEGYSELSKRDLLYQLV